MPARRLHQVTALLLGERIVGIYNATTEKQSNYLRTDPPLLWRRCDAAVIAGLLFASALAFGISTGIAWLLSLSTAVLYAPLTMALRFAWRCRARVQVDRAMSILKGREVAQPFLRRVK